MSIKKLLIVLLLLAGLVSTVQALSPVEEAKLIASDWEAWDEFGFSVAISGDTAVVGSYLSNSPLYDSGAAYIYLRTRTGWIETAKLSASDAVEYAYFGFSVAISGDTAVIGTIDGNGFTPGSAYVFQRTRKGWEEVAKLTPSDGEAGDQFGLSVAILGDTAVVGSSSGSAYVFQGGASNWAEVAKLSTSDGADLNPSVSISENTIIAGSSEAAYIFQRTATGWTETAKLTPSDPATVFGSVAISRDTAVIRASDGVYVFERHGATWTEVDILTHAGSTYSNSIATNGNFILIGAPRITESVFVFQRIGSNWIEVATLTPSDAGAVGPPGYSDKWFGNAVAISGDTALVGAVYDSIIHVDGGAAYIFKLR